MTMFTKIHRATHSLSIIAQEEHVLLLAENYEGILNLVTGEFKELEGVDLSRAKVGDKLGDMILDEDTVTQLKVMHGHLPESLLSRDTRCTLTESKLEILQASTEEDCIIDPLSSWLLAEISYLANKYHYSLSKKIQEALADPPKLWTLNVVGKWEMRFISHEEPCIVLDSEDLYVFVVAWNEELEVRRYSAREIFASPAT